MFKAKEEVKPEILEIIKDGHPTLRAKAKEVADLSSLEIRKIVADMIATAKNDRDDKGEENAVGLAAPQVNISLRIFVFREELKQEFIPVINPKVDFVGDETESGWEGCLSIPGKIGEVARYKRIRLTYQDLKGNKVTEEAEGWRARIIQHEYDHLDGILYKDKLTDPERFGPTEEMEEKFLKKKDNSLGLTAT